MAAEFSAVPRSATFINNNAVVADYIPPLFVDDLHDCASHAMLIQELTSTQCAEVLERAEIGRLGCANKRPAVRRAHSLSFDGDRGCVYSFSTVGQKVLWMREDPRENAVHE